ncbi:unnamed protein product [Blepharisma stoltei]|uniref:OPA3-like protein n=1 Tax=Blepharisma stoltei TaxID=1481888 RepID=A0AAU9KBU7_9CILI|nr:unnamed protein product [Blepharisma stoltei]
MIPLIKVFSLALRLFTRPLSNYLKISLKHNDNHHPLIRNAILNLGQYSNRINVKIQRKSLQMSSEENYIKPLPDEKALEQGSEFLGEIAAYGVLLIWGLYELNKTSNEEQAKKQKQTDLISNINAKIGGLNVQFESIQKEIQNLKNRIDLAKEETSENKL